MNNNTCYTHICTITRTELKNRVKIVARVKGQFTAAGRPSALHVSGLTPLQRVRVSHDRVSAMSIFDAPRCDFAIHLAI